jgi:hypothetical protein
MDEPQCVIFMFVLFCYLVAFSLPASPSHSLVQVGLKFYLFMVCFHTNVACLLLLLLLERFRKGKGGRVTKVRLHTWRLEPQRTTEQNLCVF